MPWTLDNPPDPAKNWTEAQRNRCVAAANAALQAGKSDKEAIFACIGAAGVSKKQQDSYDELAERGSLELQHLVELFFAGAITLSVFRRMFRENLRTHLEALILLGAGAAELTEAQIAEVSRRLQYEMRYFNDFILALRDDNISLQRALFRAGLYAYNRGAYVYGTLPEAVVGLMPVLPGDDCLGNGLCHCSLEVEQAGNEVLVHWILDPESESCAVCIAHAVESPFIFTLES